MEIIRDITKSQWNRTSLTIGKFDGVHLGHQTLIQKVLQDGKEGYTTTVFTFDKFPSQLLSHQSSPSIITEEEKQTFLSKLGVECYILFPFHKQTASMEPEQFVKEILLQHMKVKKLYVGSDFRFGKNRAGDISLLEKLSKVYEFEFETVEKKQFQNLDISSTRIRECIRQGQIEEVTAMLGRPYELSGEIVHGNNLGHKIGIPTINQTFPIGKVMPALGVYCSRVTIDNQVYYGITNIGSKPTVQDYLVYGIETHLFDCNENLYGKQATTQLLHFVRPEQKFSSLDTLMQQLEKDKLFGRNYMNSFVLNEVLERV